MYRAIADDIVPHAHNRIKSKVKFERQSFARSDAPDLFYVTLCRTYRIFTFHSIESDTGHGESASSTIHERSEKKRRLIIPWQFGTAVWAGGGGLGSR